MKRLAVLGALSAITVLFSCKQLPVDDGPPNSTNTESKYALKFDGDKNHIVLDNIKKAVTTNNTVSVWIYVESIKYGEQVWIAGVGGRQSLVVRESGKVAFTNYLAKGEANPNQLSTAWWYYSEDTEQVPLNQWVHYTGVTETDGTVTTLKLYKNAQLVSSVTIDRGINGNPGCDAFIGGVHLGNKGPECHFTSPQRFAGMIDEVAMWNRSLSPTEITDVMARKLNCDDEGLVGYWPFEEGLGSFSLDRSTYKNNALLAYGATWMKL